MSNHLIPTILSSSHPNHYFHHHLVPTILFNPSADDLIPTTLFNHLISTILSSQIIPTAHLIKTIPFSQAKINQLLSQKSKAVDTRGQIHLGTICTGTLDG
jgi:hypothetical protein